MLGDRFLVCGVCGKRLDKRNFQLFLGFDVCWVCGVCFHKAYSKKFNKKCGVKQR